MPDRAAGRETSRARRSSPTTKRPDVRTQTFRDEIREFDAAVGAGAAPRVASSTGPRAAAKPKERAGVVDRVVGAVKGVRKAKRAAAATGEALTSSKVLLVVGYFTLVSALLGTLVLYRTWRGDLIR